MADSSERDDPPPSRPSRTGRQKAINPDDWVTAKRVVEKGERARREEAKLRGHLEARASQLEHDVGALEKLCDANTSQLTLHAHRLAEIEGDMKNFDEMQKFFHGANAVLATLKWAVPVLLAATSALASGITYLLVHK